MCEPPRCRRGQRARLPGKWPLPDASPRRASRPEALCAPQPSPRPGDTPRGARRSRLTRVSLPQTAPGEPRGTPLPRPTMQNSKCRAALRGFCAPAHGRGADGRRRGGAAGCATSENRGGDGARSGVPTALGAGGVSDRDGGTDIIRVKPLFCLKVAAGSPGFVLITPGCIWCGASKLTPYAFPLDGWPYNTRRIIIATGREPRGSPGKLPRD